MINGMSLKPHADAGSIVAGVPATFMMIGRDARVAAAAIARAGAIAPARNRAPAVAPPAEAVKPSNTETMHAAPIAAAVRTRRGDRIDENRSSNTAALLRLICRPARL
jgi:hypothetical protein